MGDPTCSHWALRSMRWQRDSGRLQEPHAQKLQPTFWRKDPIAASEVRPGLPAALSRVILTAVERDKNTRYQSAAELRAAFAAQRPRRNCAQAG
jgi:hypothetical protein